MLKWSDVPPSWLAAVVFGLWWVAPGGARPELLWIGGGFVALGLALIFWAAFVMTRARTTVVPHLRASTLVTSGPFRMSRNPIYLGDALILAGLMLRWGAWWTLPLVALFIFIITQRFILSEEARLTEDFGPAFDAWCQKTRRWL